MLTEAAKEMLRVLEERKAAADQAALVAKQKAAEEWAEKRVQRLVHECATEGFGTTIEIMGFDTATPMRDDLLRLQALERRLGPSFPRDRIKREDRAGSGVGQYVLSMDLDALLEFFRRHSTRSS